MNFSFGLGDNRMPSPISFGRQVVSESNSRSEPYPSFLRAPKIIWGGGTQTSSGGEGYVALKSDFSSSENLANESRLQAMRLDFSAKLLNAVKIHPVIPGDIGPADEILRRCMDQNAAVAMQWIQSLFLANFASPAVACDLLLLVGRLPKKDAYPGGQTMALAGLSHASGAVQEAAIRAYENWGGRESLDMLRSIAALPAWLQDYVLEVIADLEAEEVHEAS